MYTINGKFIRKNVIETFDNTPETTPDTISNIPDINNNNTPENIPDIIPSVVDTNQSTTDTTLQDSDMTTTENIIQNTSLENDKFPNTLLDQESLMPKDINDNLDDLKFCVDDVCLTMSEITKFKNELSKYKCLLD